MIDLTQNIAVAQIAFALGVIAFAIVFSVFRSSSGGPSSKSRRSGNSNKV